MAQKNYIDWHQVPLTLTVEQVATIVQKSESLVCKELQAGKIKGVKTGRDWIVAKRNLMEYLNVPIPNEPIYSYEVVLETSVATLKEIMSALPNTMNEAWITRLIVNEALNAIEKRTERIVV